MILIITFQIFYISILTVHNIKLAILHPGSYLNTETFIQKHIDNLPFDKITIFGGLIPHNMTGENNDFIPLSFLEKLKRTFTPSLNSNVNDFKERRLKYFLQKYKIEVVLAEYVITASYVFHICKELNIPIIATGLGYELSIHKVISDNKTRYQNLFKHCSSIIVVAKFMEKVLVELGYNQNKIFYSPAGASFDFCEIKPDYSSKKILAIGRFVEKKAPHLTILAFWKVLNEVPDAQLIFAGDGPLLNFCIDLVKALNIKQHVSFVGKINQEEHMHYLSECRLFVQHSKIAADGDSEGTPVAIVEASSAGLAVVSTMHAGIPDVIVNNETGYLVREGDVDTMSQSIIKLLKDSSLAKKMGEAGKKNIKANFTLDKHIAILTEKIKYAAQNRSI